MSENLTKKQRRDQKKAFAEAQRTVSAERSTSNKAITIGIIIIVIVGVAWLIKTNYSPNGAPTSGSIADPRKGGEQPLVVIKEYADFQCPACQKIAPYITQALEEYGDEIAVEFNDFPLPANVHQFAFVASEAGQCANDQGKFWEYHDKLYAEQAIWSEKDNEGDVKNLFFSYADQLGLDTARFETCVNDHQFRPAVQEDVNEGDAAKVQSTPTLFINNERYAGVSTYKSLKDVIDQQLEIARKAEDETTPE